MALFSWSLVVDPAVLSLFDVVPLTTPELNQDKGVDQNQADLVSAAFPEDEIVLDVSWLSLRCPYRLFLKVLFQDSISIEQVAKMGRSLEGFEAEAAAVVEDFEVQSSDIE